MADYRDLVVWSKSYAFTLAVYRATKSFPREEAFGITSQLRHAAVSIPANIAEGNSRNSRPDYVRFLTIARGSTGELDTLLSLSKDLRYLDNDTAQGLKEQLTEIRRMLTRLMQALRAPKKADAGGAVG